MKETIKNNIENNLISLFVGSISATEFVEKYISVETTPEQEEKIIQSLKECEHDWDAAPCDSEGATKEQLENMFRIEDKCTNEILAILKIMAIKSTKNK